MNLFIKSHQKLISALLRFNVDFIVIGGYSVIFHGYNRTTGDVDMAETDNENKHKLILALKVLDIEQESLDELIAFDFTNTLFFKIGEEPDRIDFLTSINLSYEDADHQKVIADLDGMKIPFLHINHLILSKINTGRAKDKADVEMLQKI